MQSDIHCVCTLIHACCACVRACCVCVRVVRACVILHSPIFSTKTMNQLKINVDILNTVNNYCLHPGTRLISRLTVEWFLIRENNR